MRCAMNCCLSRTIIRSSSATRNQLGRSFHSGRWTGTVMHAGDIGRCTAASTDCSSGVAPGAKAAANASSGNQMSPSASGDKVGAWGCGFAAVVVLGDGLAFVRRQGRHVDKRLHPLRCASRRSPPRRRHGRPTPRALQRARSSDRAPRRHRRARSTASARPPRERRRLSAGDHPGPTRPIRRGSMDHTTLDAALRRLPSLVPSVPGRKTPPIGRRGRGPQARVDRLRLTHP